MKKSQLILTPQALSVRKDCSVNVVVYIVRECSDYIFVSRLLNFQAVSHG